jgi:hypothetical protein
MPPKEVRQFTDTERMAQSKAVSLQWQKRAVNTRIFQTVSDLSAFLNHFRESCPRVLLTQHSPPFSLRTRRLNAAAVHDSVARSTFLLQHPHRPFNVRFNFDPLSDATVLDSLSRLQERLVVVEQRAEYLEVQSTPSSSPSARLHLGVLPFVFRFDCVVLTLTRSLADCSWHRPCQLKRRITRV